MTYRNRISQIALAAVTFGALSVPAYAQSPLPPLPPHAWAGRAEMNQSAPATQSAVAVEVGQSPESITSYAQAPLPPHTWAARADANQAAPATQGAELDRQGNDESTTVAQPTPASDAPWYA